MVKLLGNPAFALFAVLSPVVLIGTTLEQRHQRARTGHRDEARYRSELSALAAALERAAASELARRRARLPDAAEVARRGELPSVQLWERRPQHDDWLRLRAGTGEVAWLPPLAEPSGPRPLALAEVLAEHERLLDAPIEVDVSDGGVVGVVGDRAAALAVVRSLIVQATVHHGPADLLVCLLVRPSAAADWDWAKWLPHTIGRDGGGRLLAADREAATALAERLARPDGVGSRPTLLLVIDDEDLLDGRRSSARALLTGRHGPVAGVVVTAAVDRLPAACRSIIELHGPDGDAVVVEPGGHHPDQPMLAAGLPESTARATARALAAHDDPELEAAGATLPDRVRLLALLDLERGDRAERLAARWAAAGPDPSPSTPIGVGVDGVCAVDLEQDGPHVLVAGTTGAGKSELLRTLVGGLAASASPEQVTFLLVDYKGGDRVRRVRAVAPHRRLGHRSRRAPCRPRAALPRSRAAPSGAPPPRPRRPRPPRLPVATHGRWQRSTAVAPPHRRHRRVRYPAAARCPTSSTRSSVSPSGAAAWACTWCSPRNDRRAR